MNEKKLLPAIYRLLDGELPPGEKEELEQYIAQHPEAAKLFRQCQAMKQELEAFPEAEADPDLKASVLQRIRPVRQAERPENIKLNFIESFWHQPAFRTGFIFVAGVFAGLLGFAVLKSEFSPNYENVKGTFYSPRSFQDLKQAGLLQFDSPQAHAVCNVRYSQNWVEIHLDISSEERVTSIFQFDTQDFSVYNIMPSAVNAQSNTLVASSSININSVGSNKYIIQLYNKTTHSHDISYKLLQNGNQLYANTATINN